MTVHRQLRMGTKMRDAVAEIQGMILVHFPDATFEVARFPEEANGIEIWATIDMDEPFDPVMDIVADRLTDLLIEDGLALHVIAVPTPERSRQLIAQAWEDYRRREHEATAT